jgi:Xaa-Pro aminopeptidase
MKSDLDTLMADRRYDALLVTGGAANNAAMYYLANGAVVTEKTVLVKKRDEPPVLFVSGMERDEAARSGLRVELLENFHILDLVRENNGDWLRATARQYGQMLAAAGVAQGTIAAYGQADMGSAYELLTAIDELHPQYRIVGEFGPGRSLMMRSRATKDAAEAKRIRAVGRKTMQVVAATEEFLTSHRAKNGYLVKQDGHRLTVGDVKAHIRQELTRLNIVDREDGTIFAIGRDAGVPHSRGRDRDPIALGKTIVYDIFPAEPGGGYFFDFTRTWCLGYASDEVQQAYDDVHATFKALIKALKPGELARTYQALTCQLLEARGHPTVGSNPRTTSGLVHSVAHGVGLDIHEAPGFSDTEANTARLDPGVVITVEPGVYYPERGFGVRIEDCLWLNPATLKFETLATYHKHLVLPVKGVKGKR